jgi:protein O-mannosyl-transferase
MLNKLNISPGNQKFIVYAILALATLAVFWQVNQYGFVCLDDNAYVRQNIHIRSGITMEGLRWAFNTTHADDLWHPLIWLSLIFDYQLYGPNAGGYHLTNLILHTLSTLLLFWLFNRMTGSVWKSAFVAGLFALHPLHVESVAWITERKDVLSAFFWMLTLCLYVYYTEKPVIRRYLLVLFAFICALMSKPMVVTLPVILILLDYWPLKRFDSQKGNWVLWQLKEKFPFFVLSAVISIFTLYAQNSYGSNLRSDLRIKNALVSFVTYPIKILWPHDLTVSYPLSTQIPLWQVLGATLLIIFISLAVIATARRLPYLFVGWLWYAITILPVIGLIKQVGDFAMADRYTYLPSIGFTIMLAWGLPSMIRSEEVRRNFLFPGGIAILAIMAVLSWKQCSYWENSIKLFSHSLQVTKNNSLAHNDLGSALYEQGKFEEAVNHYNEALQIVPRYPYALNNRGVAYIKLGQYQNAMDDFNKAIYLRPDYADAYSNRAFVYLNQGNSELGCRNAQKACALKNCRALETAYGRGLCR